MACVRDVVKSIAQAGCVKGHRYNLTVLKNKYKYSIISYQYDSYFNDAYFTIFTWKMHTLEILKLHLA